MPDSAAPAAPVPRKPRIALVCDSLEDNFQWALVDAGLAAAQAYGVDLIVIPGGKLGEMAGKNFVHTLAASWVEGVIVAAYTIGHTASERQLAGLIEHLGSVPTVALGEVPGAECCLLIDNERAAYEIAQHLVQQHRLERFAYVSGPDGNSEARERERGFSRALHEAGLLLGDDLRVVGDFTWEGGRNAICELLDRRGLTLERMQALVCANDAMAVGACTELERRGFCIPVDIAVVGFDDTELARHLPAPLTTARQPLRELLFDAMQMLVEGLRSGRAPRGSHRYSAESIHRRSCGCARLPNLPHPSTPNLLHASGRASLLVLEPALREDLDEGFVAALDAVDGAWLADLLQALGKQLDEQGTAFYDVLERLCFGLLRARKPTSGWQRALLALRRHVARGGLGPNKLPDLDRFIDGSMRLTSELTTSFLARQREELLEHLRVLSDATAGLLAAPDLGTIAAVTRSSFPKLGVKRGIVYLLSSEFGPGVSMTPLSAFGLDNGTDPGARLATTLPDELMRGRHWVVEPLGTGPRPLGLAVLQIGLAHVSWYERLRDALTAAINGAQLIQQVQRLVITDPLTGLNNRRSLTETIRRQLDPETRTNFPLSLLVLDLDGFKSLNDEHGHDEGDRALIQAADAIKRCLRDSDTLARFGGDEFVAVLPGTTAEQARAIARRVLQSLPTALREKVHKALTCSIGIATTERSGSTGDTELFRLADQALLRAKREGKNRVVHAHEM
jgi:diguanylate cyclase (GGDEF)-like protein